MQPRSPGSVSLDPLIGRVIAERYEIVQRIGSGGMGSVYRARQTSVARHVALKVLRPDLINNDHIRQRFHREAEIIARLNHPNTIRLFEFCTTEDGLAVMVMELLEGQPLGERLKSDGPLTLLEALQVGIEVARSLSEAHLMGLVHRDLKPANIFLHDVGGQRVTKVLDFGIARLMDEEATRLTVTDQVFGTPRYMSPEQGLSTASVDARSDIYSFGLILYECVVGQPPFVAQTSYQYLSAHSAERPPKLRDAVPGAPAALEALIDACLEKKPQDRPQTAQLIADQLEAIKRALESGEPVSPLPRTATGRTATGGATTVQTDVSRTPEQRDAGRRLVWIGAAAAGAALVALGIAFASRTGRPVASVDAGVATLDGGAAFALGPPADPPPQAEVGAPDAAVAPVEEAPKPKPNPRAKPKPKRKTRPKRTPKPPAKPKQEGGDALVGQGTIRGPRGLVIPIEDSEVDLLRQAMKCKESIYRGLSAITTRRCPADCAILVDAACAGRTPAQKRPIPPGRREVAVVCKGKILRTASVLFAENDVTKFNCR